MTRSLIRIGLALAGNAIGLLLAGILLDDMSLSGVAFFIAVLIFTALIAVIDPLIVKLAADRVPAFASASALIATFVALVLTSLLSDGLNIDGTTTWVLATVLVWLLATIAGVVLPKFFLKEAATP